jgi:trimeric autotransporter adhesin
MTGELTMKNKFKKISSTIILASITAVFAIGSFNGCKVQDYSAKTSTISIDPVATKIAPNTTQKFTPSYRLSDGSTTPMNNSVTVTWTSSDTTIATVDRTGLATAGTITGTTTIIATDADGVRGSATLEVGTVKSASELPDSIAITPANPSVVLGRSMQMTATGTYADASTQDLTATVTWTSSDEATAVIDNTGYVQVPSSATVGATATITAKLTDAGSGTTVTGTTVLTVTKSGGH